MLKDIDPITFNLLLDKSLNPVDHRAKFELHLSAIFTHDDKRTVVFPEGLTELEKLACKMNNLQFTTSDKLQIMHFQKLV